MNRLIFFVVILFSATISFSQKTISVESNDEVYTIVEEMPEFPGGNAELYKFISSNIILPVSCHEDKHFLSCKVFVKFVVTAEGEAVNAIVVKGCPGNPDCDKEAKRVIGIMPKWKPGKMNGKAVSVYYMMPIKFTK
ncbi:MAG: hypothetical protein K0S32_814 [Bacteroidetes bacterium]|jgi:protein TonB|nr:hypothetical protein [Bacteroidota bacterium]